MAPASQKKFNINLLIPFLLIAIVFGVTIWQKYRASQELPPLPPIQQPAGRWTAVLFFVADGTRLAREARELDPCDDVNTCMKDVLEELVNGPVGQFDPALPDGTAINKLLIDKDQVIIDLNRVFAETLPSGSSAEMLAVYSIVNTVVTNFPQIAMVKFTFDGEVKSLLGHLDLSEPLVPDYNLELPPVPPVPPSPKKAVPGTSKNKKGQT